MASGTLYIVATPIGNLEDITLRALRILKEVDLIAAEDTRHTRKLLTHFGIAKPLTSYFDHNKAVKGDAILVKLQAGLSVALVTDAGNSRFRQDVYDLGAQADLSLVMFSNLESMFSVGYATAFGNGKTSHEVMVSLKLLR